MRRDGRIRFSTSLCECAAVLRPPDGRCGRTGRSKRRTPPERGADYAEEALTARIAGRPRPSRQPQQRTGKPSLLIDIQNNLKAQQSAGYKHWAVSYTHLDVYKRQVRKIREMDETIPIAFTTTSTEHTLESYRLSVLKYLEKPRCV